jgi:uncharacterized protein (DUF1800 family)
VTTGTLTEFVRFGYGPAPQDRLEGVGVDAGRLLGQLTDGVMPRAGMTSRERLDLLAEQRRASEAAKAGGPKENKALMALRALTAQEAAGWVWDAVTSETGFAERLLNFWANRLTVAWRKGPAAYLLGPYREEAIRPHVGGRFADMLAASAWHPAMLEYLDQAASVGPESVFGRKKRKGLNENYAREFLELHSMGTGYDQADVTELARLFAGMQYSAEGAFFDEDRAEPGEKTILGQRFGSGPDEVARLIGIVARRPETAENVARALAGHFITDDPPADLVAGMAGAYLEGDTALAPVYRVLLQHPAAVDPAFRKVRNPHEYVVATIRALGLTPDLASGKGRLKTGEALADMGQPVFRAPGPDGWPDTAEDWVTAPALAARLNWAEMLARRFGEQADPVALARRMLAPAEEHTVTAVGRAEQRWEGLAVLLGAPALMRR